MTVRTVARQYALALFEVAQKGGLTERVGRELAEFAALVASHAELSAIFANTAVPPADKRAVVDRLVQALPGLSQEVTRLLTLLADRDRLMLLDAIAAVFKDKA